MNLLVTGGAGFIGSNFIHYWLNNYPDDTVVNLDALTYAGNLENLQSLEDNSQYQFVKGSICDKRLVNKMVAKVDTIVHFAAESHVDRSIQGPEVFIDTNVTGTLVLLEAAKKNSTRFHHISTDEVFGDLADLKQDAFDESTPYSPSSPYSASKAAADHLVRAYHRTYQLPITISNCSNNFGPFMFPEKLFALAITNLIENKPVPVYGDGQQIRDWLYVTDHCRAIELILQSGTIGETYCIGGMTQEITNLDALKMILQIMGKEESLLQFVTDRPGHDVRYAVNWSKAKQELGYQPQHSFTDYLNKTVTWYQQNQDWWKRVKSGAYQEYYQQQYGN